MTVTNSLTRQPTKLDYASPTQFKFSILKLPKVEYFCTSVNIPGINLGETTQATPLKNIPIPGDKLTYEPLQMTFLVDENLENFQEIHGWLVGIGFPRDNSEFRNAKIITVKLNSKIKFNLLYDKNRSLQKKIKIEQLRKEVN